MPLDASRLTGLRELLEKGQELVLLYQGQTGALNLTQESANKQLEVAGVERDLTLEAANSAYNKAEAKAGATRAAATAAANAAYSETVDAQRALLEAAQAEVTTAEHELRAVQQAIKTEYGYDTNLFPAAAAGNTIRVG